MINNLGDQNSILNQFMVEIRDEKIQKDPMRFRRNLERVGEVMAYEISKTLTYQAIEVKTPLATADAHVSREPIVLATILRAGLPIHQGFLNYFDQAENALIDFNFLGIKNLLILQGDAGRGQDSFIADPDGHTFAVELVEQVMKLNKGQYLDDSMEKGYPSAFCVGVAGYPEKHYAASSLDSDIQYLKAKVLAGADYIVTQMFFDNKYYFDFVAKCRAAGIEVPILPGLKPIAMLDQVDVLPRLFHLNMPEALTKEIRKCKDNKEALEVGTHWTTEQAKELMKAGAPVLHFYTLGAGNSIRRIAEAIF